MLGTVESDRNWRWAAFGKHPVVSDFFRIGFNFLLARGFSDWVENGYHVLAAKKEGHHSFCSWRFWAKGPQKNSLACGLVRDSIDSLGRSYPLLMVGTGPLKIWEEQWDLLPFACERTWEQMEYLSAQRFNDFKKLEVEIHNIRPPLPEWPELASKRRDCLPKTGEGGFFPPEAGFMGDQALMTNLRKSDSMVYRDLIEKASRLSGKAEIFVRFDQDAFHDQFTWVSLWHFLLKQEERRAPNVFFMGGTLESACLAVFRRPLLPADFVGLWSVASAGPSPIPSPQWGEGRGEGKWE